ncbi:MULTISPECIES: VWA domain-containing protein [unclassified Leptolyngbya]|uniref:VWA domain-containing protein n=1 Tax=unclassified Leptolyngbya TaxID=2650499 RepID=UPI0016841084|nr:MULTISPECIES: VWA domain-containing protein [unclassified Leptolyngbya]MBD1909049.1 VWA domain-containing protein [Leptolyngbya sp. FACHB-8]MBD2157430.1 VWA domain-containing protein [Leptolyngbya sp. FACHB-16]
MTEAPEQERLRRWRLILGGGAADGITGSSHGTGDDGFSLGASDQAIDQTLGALYDGDRQGGLGGSSPKVARWLGDIRTYFPTSVVKVMQQDALERLNLRQMLLEPELLEAVEPDVHLVSNLLSLSGVMPGKTKETARIVVRRVVEDLIRKLENPTRQAILGSLNRSIRNRRPRHHEIDWHRTIRANLKHYQPQYRSIIPETRIGFGRKRSALRDIILCVDQSGSMATSVVYAGIFSAVLASLPAVQTKLVVFDTAVVDLTDLLQDPVEVLFGTQLGGGTDINQALAYCQGLVRQPQDTILVLISDLYEGGNSDEMRKRISALVASGIQFITLLALNDDGAPCYDHSNTKFMASLGILAFACTPDRFPDLMAAAINRQDLNQWVAAQETS